MMRKVFVAKGIILIALGILAVPARPAAAQDQSSQPPPYTIPEYNAYQAARAETNAQNRVKLLDDFVSKFPNSTLTQYIYQLYIQSYSELKTYPKVIEYCDKLLAMGDKVDAGDAFAVTPGARAGFLGVVRRQGRRRSRSIDEGARCGETRRIVAVGLQEAGEFDDVR